MKKQRKVFFIAIIFSISLISGLYKYSIAADKDIKSPLKPESSPVDDLKKYKKYKKIKKFPSLHEKADLIVENIVINREYPNDVDLVITIKNQGGSTTNSLSDTGRSNGSRGECTAIVKWRTGQTEEYINLLCESSIPPLSKNEKHEFSCRDHVPAAHIHEYRAVVDNMDWIDERNESNNTNSARVINY